MHDMAEVPTNPKRPRTEGDVERERVANKICEQLVEMSTTIQSFRTELRLIRENQKGLGVKLKKMEENQKGIVALIKDIQKSTFKIKDGPYEVRKCS